MYNKIKNLKEMLELKTKSSEDTHKDFLDLIAVYLSKIYEHFNKPVLYQVSMQKVVRISFKIEITVKFHFPYSF